MMATTNPINIGTGKAPNQLINSIILSNSGFCVDCMSAETFKSRAEGGKKATMKDKNINPEHRVIKNQVTNLFLFTVAVSINLYKITGKPKNTNHNGESATWKDIVSLTNTIKKVTFQ